MLRDFIKLYLKFIAFLHTDKAQVVEIIFHGSKPILQYIINIMGADVLVTQRARTSRTMLLTLWNCNNSVPEHLGLK